MTRRGFGLAFLILPLSACAYQEPPQQPRCLWCNEEMPNCTCSADKKKTRGEATPPPGPVNKYRSR